MEESKTIIRSGFRRGKLKGIGHMEKGGDLLRETLELNPAGSWRVGRATNIWRRILGEEMRRTCKT